mgnify:CR=1 FL=1
MGHAVFVQRLVVGITPLALLFLTVLGVLVFIAGCALLAKAVHRYRDSDLDEADTTDPIYATNVYEWLASIANNAPELSAGIARLRNALRDKQQEGDRP